MAGHCRKRGVEIWAYCLMPNHVHLVAVPETEESLRQAIAEAHRRYTRMINFREGWRGYLWQGRFSSFPMDDEYLYRAARYIEMNPVRAGLVDRADDYRWSSAAAHLTGVDDKLVKAATLLDKSIDWREYLREAENEEFAGRLRRHQCTGRPFGGPGLLEKIQQLFGRDLKPKKPGRKPKKGKK